MSIFQDIQSHYKKANIVEKFIYIIVAVYVITLLITSFSGLYQNTNNFIVEWFSLRSNFNELINKPWTIITYSFLHGGFLHVLMNSIVLFYIGNLFLEYFTSKQFLNFFFLGTFFGGILFLISFNYFPLFKGQTIPLVGASAGISAIFIGMATYLPNYQFKLRFIGYVKLWHLAAIWILLDLLQLSGNNGGGHFAHLGGALFGFLYVYFASNKEIEIFKSIKTTFEKKEKPLKTVYKAKKKVARKEHVKPRNQEKVDSILDKISKSGYDTLSKEEKDFLFRQGKK